MSLFKLISPIGTSPPGARLSLLGNLDCGTPPGNRELTRKAAGPPGGKLQPLDRCQLSEIYIHTEKWGEKKLQGIPCHLCVWRWEIYGKFTAYIPAPCRIKCATFPDDGDSKGYR